MPHPCGIATFTYDLATAAFPRQIVALHPPTGPATYPAEVRHRIRRDEREDYVTVAEALGSTGVDVVSLQYEPDIWGGEDGAFVLDFVEAVRLPVVTTLHTVVRKPTPAQRRIVTGLVERSAVTVVMSSGAASVVHRAYGIDAGRLVVIPHGVPNLPLVDPDTIKPRLDLAGRLVILGFGLLRPEKGYEPVIEAMPAVVEAMPAALFVILGSSHPDELAAEGDAYRSRLQATAERVGMTDHVRFVDKFVGRVELANWLEAADVFVTPYENADRLGSGTLSLALGAGKAVVSTPFAYARERLAGRRGTLIPREATVELAEALVRLLGDRELRTGFGRRAYDQSRDTVWSAVGAEYRRIFVEVARAAAPASAATGRYAAVRG